MQKTGEISYFSLTAGGALLALKLCDRFGGAAHLPRCHSVGCPRCDPFDSIAEALSERFRAGDTLVCVMAAGIVFRVLAPFMESKRDDPAVIVLDEESRHVVPLLGGHAAGANRIAREIAGFIGGEAVITTSSDVQGLTAPDEMAALLGLIIDDPVALRRVTSLLVDGRPVCIEGRDNPGIDGYGWVPAGGDTGGYAGRLLISHMADDKTATDSDGTVSSRNQNAAAAGTPAVASMATVRLIPRAVVAGIGCRRGVSADEIVDAIKQACAGQGIDPRAVGTIASIDIKQDEPGMKEAAAALGAETAFFAASELAALGRPGSKFVEENVGTPAVCEPAALLAAGVEEPPAMGANEPPPMGADEPPATGKKAAPVTGKEAFGRVTVALTLRAHDFESGMGKVKGGFLSVQTGNSVGISRSGAPSGQTGNSVGISRSGVPTGQVLIVGTGAGTAPLLTESAAAALREADVVMGYRTYVEQVRAIFPGKEFIAGTMGAEIERCREALALAATGHTVALVSSGDPGVYGMAGPLLELAGETPVTVIPGVTAAQIAAARLGAPLMNDYITLSLSDLLTPREEVRRRARLAAASDMVICLYNPTSRKRHPLFEEVCGILAEERSPETPVGWVREAGSPTEAVGIVPLAELPRQDIDMRTIIIVGNSRTRVVDGRMITRRGYENKGDKKDGQKDGRKSAHKGGQKDD